MPIVEEELVRVEAAAAVHKNCADDCAVKSTAMITLRLIKVYRMATCPKATAEAEKAFVANIGMGHTSAMRLAILAALFEAEQVF